MTEEEQKAIEKLEIEGTENNYLEVKIVLDLIDKQQETLRKQSYTNKKLRNKIKTIRSDYIHKDKIKKLKNQVETKISKAELDRNYGRYKQYGGKIKCDKYLAQLYGYKQAFSLLLNEGEEENE